MSKKLHTPTGRATLATRPKPYFATLVPGLALGYRKNAGTGSWVIRVADGNGGNWTRQIGFADDQRTANGDTVLSYDQAAAKASAVQRGRPEHDGKVTVRQALEAYGRELEARGGLPGNVSRVMFHLPARLVDREVSAVTVEDLKMFRDGIKAAPATVNRTIRILKAALNQLAEADERLSDSAWRVGLKQKKNSHRARNVVLADDQVRDVVSAAYAADAVFGLFVELHAVTGARTSQIARLEVRDLQADQARVMMPTSRKGTGDKPRHIPVPITAGLASKLRVAAAGRSPGAPLLLKGNGIAWSAENGDHRDPFARAVEDAGLDPKVVTIYALRHSSIVRQIKANKAPLRTIAATHDTSVKMIEANYARDIPHYDDSMRAGLLELEPDTVANVVKLRG